MSESLDTKDHYGDRILRILNQTDSKKIGLLLRHSVKNNDNGEGNEVGLSELGFSEARRFGRLLPSDLSIRLSHSPVSRCLETAVEIGNGFSEVRSGFVGNKGIDKFLDAFGFFSKDFASALSYKQTIGTKPFVRQWLNGTLRGDVMWRPSDVRSFLSNYFHSEMQNTETTTLRIWVSHDYSIAVMRELLFGANVEAEPWISYLDGLVLMYDSNDKMLANWNGNNAPVPEFRATGAPE